MRRITASCALLSFGDDFNIPIYSNLLSKNVRKAINIINFHRLPKIMAFSPFSLFLFSVRVFVHLYIHITIELICEANKTTRNEIFIS